MGYFGRLEDKLRAQELRKKGLSYKEILVHITVSKDTLSRWCRDIVLTEEQKSRLLEKKFFGQKKGSLIAAENKKRKRLQEIQLYKQQAKKDLGFFIDRDRFIAGIALYAGEGNKTDGQGGLTNSDPKIIKFMINWFKEFCHIPISKFRGALWIREGLDEKKAKYFWSELTGIPIQQFHKTYIAKNINSRAKKNIHEFGIFSIRFSDSVAQRRIMGWISAMLDDKIVQHIDINSPVAQW